MNKAMFIFCLVVMSSPAASDSLKDQQTDIFNVSKEPISIFMANWCPYSGECEIGDGYVSEVLRVIFERAGLEVSFTTTPWTRGVVDTRAGISDGLLNPAKGVAADLYYSQEETGIYTYCYYTKPNDKWTYTGVDSLKSRKTATLKDAAMGEDKEFIEDQLNSHLFIPIAYTKSYMNQIIGMLHADRVDTIVNSPFVTNYHFKMKRNNHKELRNAGCIASRKVWFGLAPVLAKKNRVEAIGRIVDRGIRLLRKDGTLSIILSKYGLKDWR